MFSRLSLHLKHIPVWGGGICYVKTLDKIFGIRHGLADYWLLKYVSNSAVHSLYLKHSQRRPTMHYFATVCNIIVGNSPPPCCEGDSSLALHLLGQLQEECLDHCYYNRDQNNEKTPVPECSVKVFALLMKLLFRDPAISRWLGSYKKKGKNLYKKQWVRTMYGVIGV